MRAEHLKDISEADAIDKGIKPCTVNGESGFKNYFKFAGNNRDFYPENIKWMNFSEDDVCSAAVVSFCSVWLSIYGINGWRANPVVWVYEFEIVDEPMLT